MDQALQDLISLLELEQRGENRFRGQSRDTGLPQVFGGQVLAQALAAASCTVSARRVHSLHAYFLRPGDAATPIDYEVDRARDGGSFTSRRVVAVQHGEQIFNLAASFQAPEAGLEHQARMPDVPHPDQLGDIRELAGGLGVVPTPRIRRVLASRKAFRVKPVCPEHFLVSQPFAPVKRVWMKAVDSLPDAPLLHDVLLAYVSDYDLISTATLPHGLHASFGGLQMASLDHAMWFHHDFRLDDWLLYTHDAPVAAGARGFNRGLIYTREGKLIASVVQEGLMRPRKRRAEREAGKKDGDKPQG